VTFDLAADMDDVFLTSGFEENVIYTPSGGSAATIAAIVQRDRPAEERNNAPGSVGGSERRYPIEITVSATDVATVTPHNDVVQIYAKVGDATRKSYRVASIISQDDGAWQLGLTP
jgi:hypothetical protein